MRAQITRLIGVLAVLLLFSPVVRAQDGAASGGSIAELPRFLPKIKFCKNPEVYGWRLPNPRKVHPSKAFASHMCRLSYHLDWLTQRVDQPKHAKGSIKRLRRMRKLLKALYRVKPHSINKMPRSTHQAAMVGYQACMDDVIDWLGRCQKAVQGGRFAKARFYIDHIRTMEHQCHLGYAFPKY